MSNKTDVWMPLYIGDYLASTSHLSAEESGAYLHLLMHSWKEGPLPSDLEKLRRIARVEKDAWSTAWLVLKDFFKQDEGGCFVQMRLQREKSEWMDKKTKAVDKARVAAEARYKKLLGASPKQVSSNAQALLETCPSPSPSPIDQKQEQTPVVASSDGEKLAHLPAKAKASKTVDPRREAFIEDLKRHWDGLNNGSPEFAMDGADGKQINAFLAKWKNLSRTEWQKYLRNRKHSENLIPSEEIRRWVGKLMNYASGPMNTYNRMAVPQHDSGTAPVDAVVARYRSLGLNDDGTAQKAQAQTA